MNVYFVCSVGIVFSHVWLHGVTSCRFPDVELVHCLWEKLTWVGHRPARIILLFMFTNKNVCAQARDPLCTKLAGAHLFARLLHRDESTTKMGQASSLGSLAVSPSSCEESRRCSFSLPSLVLPILHTVEEL